MTDVLRTAEAHARWGRPAVRHRLARGLWQSPCRGVVVTHNGPLGADDLLRVALASTGPTAALGGLSALLVDGLTGFRTVPPHLVLPPGARTPSLPGVVVHRSTELSELDVHPSREPRRTRPGRSVVDAASWAPSDGFARIVVLAAFQQRLVGARQVREALTRRGPCRRRALVVESVLDAVGGVQSLPERDLGRIWRATGLPAIGRQRAVRGPSGRYFLDVWCPRLGLGVEVHGVPHMAVAQWDDDLTRANEVAITGVRQLAFSSYAVRRQPRVVADQLVRMAQALGWRGSTDLDALRSLERPRRMNVRRSASAR
jgi:very-short-patch-repair endonuclease